MGTLEVKISSASARLALTASSVANMAIIIYLYPADIYHSSALIRSQPCSIASCISTASCGDIVPANRSSCRPEMPQGCKEPGRANSSTRSCNSCGSAFTCSATLSGIVEFICALGVGWGESGRFYLLASLWRECFIFLEPAIIIRIC